MNSRSLIAKRVAQEFKNGDIVNLGIGIPTLVADYIPKTINVTLHSENGFVGVGSAIHAEDPDLTNAGGQLTTILAGGSTFDSAGGFGGRSGRQFGKLDGPE